MFNRAQNLRQRFRIQLGGSTRTVRITGQADLPSGWVYIRHGNSSGGMFSQEILQTTFPIMPY